LANPGDSAIDQVSKTRRHDNAEDIAGEILKPDASTTSASLQIGAPHRGRLNLAINRGILSPIASGLILP